ncbi:flagellar hook-length control protein FliK [Marinomonas sp.]|uniref:flagellar hook-length control protein FliK n=1 Tax=Marinomonas sp. TaxID=1904862 RepID=UPI003BACA94E
MISDIQSTLNASSGKQSNTSNSKVLNNVGTIARLGNEMKLIESLSLIKFQGSELLNFQGKPTQILHATSAQQPFTLINTGTPIDISDIKNAQLSKSNPQQATLTIPVNNQLNKSSILNAPQVKQVDNLMLASRVVNLTVTSATPSSANNTTLPQPPTATVKIGTGTNAPGRNPTGSRITSNNTLPQNIAQTVANTPVANASTTPAITASANAQPSNSAPAVINQVQSTTPAAVALNQTQATTAASPTNPQLATVTDGQSEFPILSQTPLKKGDVVRVMVDANNNMQVLPPKTNTAPPSAQVEALKQSLPRQLSLGDMSQLVNQLQKLNDNTSTLPPQTQQALRQLIQNIPALGSLTTSPEAMKQAIQTSGVFSESLLANNTTQLPADLKLNLHRLKDVQENTGALRLGSIPTEQIANAIERITTSQLRHFSDANQVNNTNYPLHIELPIKNGQTTSFVGIEINKDASSTAEEQKQDRRWLVKLKFDFEETGRFDARASIQANKVGILFAAEDPETVQKLQRNLSTLKQQLKDKDIEVERLDAFQAKLDKEKANIVKTQSLIDVRT